VTNVTDVLSYSRFEIRNNLDRERKSAHANPVELRRRDAGEITWRVVH